MNAAIDLRIIRVERIGDKLSHKHALLQSSVQPFVLTSTFLQIRSRRQYA